MSDKQFLVNKIKWPSWAKSDDRYQKLHVLDLFLNGKQYDSLEYAYSQEYKDGPADPDNYIPIYERRPSAQYNLIGSSAKKIARKLFAGSNAPRIIHEKDDVRDKIQRLLEEGEVEKLMPDVAYSGSIGSVAITFKIVGQGEQGRLRCRKWDAKFCFPCFDALGNLSMLRIAYQSPGYEFIDAGIKVDAEAEEIKSDKQYWRVVDHLPNMEKCYKPPKADKWNPRASETKFPLVEDKEESKEHNLGFVQAQWFVNLAGGMPPDGACTWEFAIPLQITLDYLLSQLCRAVFYNGAPQVVVKGEPTNFDEGRGATANRAPSTMLMFQATVREQDGTVTEGGDAHLLEMKGEGITVGITLAERLETYAYKAMGATAKDPDKVASVITGKAMELLDQEVVDLRQELRTCYGKHGLVPLAKKIALAAIIAKHPLMDGINDKDVDGLTLQWPKTYLPTPQEIQQLVPAIVAGVDAQIIDKKKGADYLESQIDFPVFSANREVLDADAGRSNASAGGNSLPDKERDDIVTPQLDNKQAAPDLGM